MDRKQLDKIEVVQYNDHWPALYEKEKHILTHVLQDIILEIHHVGSTAVPGLCAKPIIDFLIVVNSFKDVDNYFDRLLSK